MGNFFYDANDVSDPDDLYYEHMCLRSDLVADCSFNDLSVWTDEGGTALKDCSVWNLNHTSADTDVLFTDFLYANNDHDNPPNLVPKCIKESAVLMLRGGEKCQAPNI